MKISDEFVNRPAVSGAHNTIVAARAGKDLVSSLASGLLTIGPRFGGMLNFFACLTKTQSDFVDNSRGFLLCQLWIFNYYVK